MKISLPDSTLTQVLASATSPLGHGVWFQNFSTTDAVNLVPGTSQDFVLDNASFGQAQQFALAPAADADHPTTLILQSSGGDTTLVNTTWKAYQASGGAIDFFCGRW